MENFILLQGAVEICITDYYEHFKRKGKIPMKRNPVTHFKYYQQAEMTGNTRRAV